MTIIVKEVIMFQPCDRYCPELSADDNTCLPCYYDVQEMLQQLKVWMCTSDNTKPCIATGLTEVPDRYIRVTETQLL